MRRWGVGLLWRVTAITGAATLAGAVCASRLYLGYHDARQVGAGVIVGAVAGTCWHVVTQVFLRPAFPALAATPFARFLLVRDCTNVPNVLWAEYLVASPQVSKGRRA